MRKTAALRSLLKNKEFVYMPVAYDALGGRLLHARWNPPHNLAGVEIVLHHLRPRRCRRGHRPAREVDVQEVHGRCELDLSSVGSVDQLFGLRHQLRLLCGRDDRIATTATTAAASSRSTGARSRSARCRQQEPDHRRQRLVDDVELAAIGVDCAGPEVGAAVVSRHLDRSFKAWRREQSFVAIGLEPRAQLVLRLLRQVRVDVFFGERLPGEGRRLRRERLRRRGPLARHVGLRNRTFLDRPDRLTGFSIEDEEEPLLRRLRDHLPRFAVLADRQQLG